VFERQWFEIVKASPSEGRRVRFWDKAATEGGGCFTAGVLINKSKDGIFYVEHVARAQLSALNRNKLIEQTARDDAQRYGKVEICVEEEPGSGGKESAEFTIRQLSGFSVYAERPSGDKVERAQPLAAQAEAGNVKLVEGPWNRDYLDELCSFPEGRADQVDASSAAFNRLNNVKKKFWMAI
jgi:predicted phage terminase large subunit-like protein